MSHLGRPTAYKPEYCELAHNYCLLGATAEELAGFFGVTRGTINNWIAKIPEFATALRNRQRRFWSEKAATEPEDTLDFVAALDAAGESMRNAGD
jgi:hypothetical protein